MEIQTVWIHLFILCVCLFAIKIMAVRFYVSLTLETLDSFSSALI